MLSEIDKNCREFGIKFFGLDDEGQGIVHVIGPELGLTQPGMTIACGDSHTSTHGAFGSIAFGIGTLGIVRRHSNGVNHQIAISWNILGFLADENPHDRAQPRYGKLHILGFGFCDWTNVHLDWRSAPCFRSARQRPVKGFFRRPRAEENLARGLSVSRAHKRNAPRPWGSISSRCVARARRRGGRGRRSPRST